MAVIHRQQREKGKYGCVSYGLYCGDEQAGWVKVCPEPNGEWALRGWAERQQLRIDLRYKTKQQAVKALRGKAKRLKCVGRIARAGWATSPQRSSDRGRW